MEKHFIREISPSDIPALGALWIEVFGDSEGFVREYFRLLPGFGRCAAAELDGRPVGMASVITGLELIRPCLRPVRCGYVYAVAVGEAARHRGLGSALTKEACRLGREQGAELLCTLPAEDSLYPWYEELMGVRCALYRRRLEALPAPCAEVRRLSAEEYFSRREALLSPVPHLRLCPAAGELAGIFYETYGGGLFSCGGGLCAAYGSRSEIIIKELISPDGEQARCAAALCAALGASKAVYYIPSADGEKYISADSDFIPKDCVWSMSFD